MKIPNWIKPGFWGMVLGAVAATALGFGDDLVVTTSDAKEMATQQSQEAIVAALTPICVFQFKEATKEEQVASLTKLEQETYYLRGKFVEEQGWATMPGSTKPNNVIADECAVQLLKLND